MTIRVTVNIGFITNSSSCINCFPNELLEHEDVKAFIEKYDIAGGYTGGELMMRSEAEGFLLNEKDKRHAAEVLAEYHYDVPEITDEDKFTVIYSDEYDSLSMAFCSLLSATARKLGMNVYSYDYN